MASDDLETPWFQVPSWGSAEWNTTPNRLPTGLQTTLFEGRPLVAVQRLLWVWGLTSAWLLLGFTFYILLVVV